MGTQPSSTQRPRRRSGRKRRLAGWALLTLAAATAVLWIVSGWWWIQWHSPVARLLPGRDFTLMAGGVMVAVSDSGPPRNRVVMGQWSPSSGGWDSGRITPAPHWSFSEHWFANYEQGPNGSLIDQQHRILFAIDVIGAPGSQLRLYSAPLWPLIILLFACGWIVLANGRRAHRRAMNSGCAKCGYPLAGLVPGAVCPECGKAGAVQ